MWRHSRSRGKIARQIEREHSTLVVSNMAKSARAHGAFINWSQNSDYKSKSGVSISVKGLFLLGLLGEAPYEVLRSTGTRIGIFRARRGWQFPRQVQGLQNPYSSVRFRPAPPTFLYTNSSEANDLSGCCSPGRDRLLCLLNLPDFASKWHNCGESALKRWTEKWTAVHPLPYTRQYLRIIVSSRTHFAACRGFNTDIVYQWRDDQEPSPRELSPTLAWRCPELYSGDAHGPDEKQLNLDIVASPDSPIRCYAPAGLNSVGRAGFLVLTAQRCSAHWDSETRIGVLQQTRRIEMRSANLAQSCDSGHRRRPRQSCTQRFTGCFVNKAQQDRGAGTRDTSRSFCEAPPAHKQQCSRWNASHQPMGVEIEVFQPEYIPTRPARARGKFCESRAIL